MKLFYLIIFSTQFFLTLSCTLKSEFEDKNYELQYRYNVNGCDTGKQLFRSSSEKKTLELYCKALLNDTFNNSCAEDSRRNLFESKCEGAGYEWDPIYE